MRVKGKRVLKNGVTAGYVKQEDGSWKWRFLSGPKKSRKRGGVREYNEKQNRNTLNRAKATSKKYENDRARENWDYRSRHGINLSRGFITNQNREINRIRGLERSKKRAKEAKNLILASKQKQNIVEFIKTTNKALEEIDDPNQIPSIIQTINSILQNNISSLGGHANNRGNANKLTKQLNELQKKAEKRIKLLENKNEKNSEQNQMYPIINELLKSLHNGPQGTNRVLSILPTVISGRKQTKPNLDSGLSINKLKNLLDYLEENPSVFKSQNNTERKMITDSIKSLISKIYQYYYIKFITNSKLQRLLENPGFLREEPEGSERGIINEIEENGGNALFYIKQVNSPNLYAFILKYFMRKFIEKDLDPYLIAQFTNIQGKLPNLIPKDAYAESINANAMPNWMQNNNQLLESGGEIYRMRVEGRFFAQLMNNLIIPMLKFKNQTNIEYVDEEGIAVVLVPNIFGMSEEKIGDISLEGLDYREKFARVFELKDIMNNLFVTLINNYLRDKNIVINTNHPQIANTQPNEEGGATKGGSRKRRKRK